MSLIYCSHGQALSGFPITRTYSTRYYTECVASSKSREKYIYHFGRVPVRELVIIDLNLGSNYALSSSPEQANTTKDIILVLRHGFL